MDEETREQIQLLRSEIERLRSQMNTMRDETGDLEEDITELYGWQQTFNVADHIDVGNRLRKTRYANTGMLLENPGGFSGVVYFSGNKYDNLNSDDTLPWVRVNVVVGTVSEDAGPPPNPFPQNEEWYEKAIVSGDIHVPMF